MRAWLTTRIGGLSPRRRLFFAGVSVVVTAAALLAGLQAGGVFGGPPPRTVASAPDTVLLVPGYGGGKTALDVLAARIRRTGMRAQVVTLPGQGTGDLTAQASVLNSYVNRVLHAGVGQLDVIGYSAGGVVTRLWDATDNGAQKVHLVITLGSPLNGTRLAAAGSAADPSACPVACQELIPGSALLTKLRRTPLGRKPGWLSLWSVDDQVVRPPDSAKLAGAVNVPLQSVCPGMLIEHGGLPTSPLVIGIVLQTLGPGPLTAPRPADCSALQRLGAAGGAGQVGGGLAGG
jgi:triacylglycerol lipase